jgi:hypothetical protein
MAAGKKTGGRQKGVPNKRTVQRMALVDQATSQGISPLEVMLGAMREAWEAGDKEAAANFAKDAAPYIHPRLAAVEHSGNQDKPLSFNITSGVPRETEEPEHVNGHSGTSH